MNCCAACSYNSTVAFHSLRMLATVDNSITIDSFGPLPVKRPASVAEVCDLVKHTRAAKQAIYPVGGRTTLDIGLPPTKPGIACDTNCAEHDHRLSSARHDDYSASRNHHRRYSSGIGEGRSMVAG